MSADIETSPDRAFADDLAEPRLSGKTGDTPDRRVPHRRRAVTVGGLILAAAGATAIAWVGVAANDDTGTARVIPSAHSASDAQQVLAHQVIERKRFGLNADPGYVASLQGRPDLDVGYIGVPIIPSEVAEMDARNRAGLKLASIDAALSTQQPSTFGGTWIDQAAGGVAVIASTDPTSVNMEKVSKMLPPGAKTEVRTVAVPLAYLQQLDARVGSDPLLHENGAGYGIFEMENRVQVDLPTSTPMTTVELLYSKYGKRGLYIRLVDSYPGAGTAAPR